MKLIIILAALIGLGFSGFGQIVTDRPDQTESSAVVGKGVLQIESGVSFTSLETDLVKLDNWALPNILWRLGVSERWELRVVTQPEFQKQFVSDSLRNKTLGFANLQVGFKVNIVKGDNGKTEIGFLSHLITPTGTNGISIPNYGVTNKLAVTHTVTEDFAIAYNVGYDYLGIGNGDLTYSLAFGYGLSQRVGVYAEVFGGYTEFADFGTNIDMGFTYLFSDNVQFDYSFGFGLTENMNYHSIGCSFRLGDL